MAVPLLLPINAFDIFFCIVKGVFIKHRFKISADVKAAAMRRTVPYIKLDMAPRIYIVKILQSEVSIQRPRQ